jgi:nitrogen regulatory protein PII
MRKIEAIIRKERFEDVRKALETSGIGGMTFFEGFGIGKKRDAGHEIMKLEIYVDEFQLESVE